MVEAPIQLNRGQRQRLLQALSAPMLYDTAAGRDTLLIDLHDSVAPTVARATGKWADLAAIVEAAERWGQLPDGTPALQVLIDDAISALAGSDSARTLATLRDELTAPPPFALPAPPAPVPARQTGPATRQAAPATRQGLFLGGVALLLGTVLAGLLVVWQGSGQQGQAPPFAVPTVAGTAFAPATAASGKGPTPSAG